MKKRRTIITPKGEFANMYWAAEANGLTLRTLRVYVNCGPTEKGEALHYWGEKKVPYLHLNTRPIRTPFGAYESLREAARKIGVDRRTINELKVLHPDMYYEVTLEKYLELAGLRPLTPEDTDYEGKVDISDILRAREKGTAKC